MSVRSRSSFLAGAAAAATLAVARPVGAQTSQPLRLAGVFSDLFAEPWYAKDSGILARSGFDADVSALVNAGAVAAAIGGGSIDVGVGDLVTGVKAVLTGIPIQLIAGSALQISSEVSSLLATLNSSPIKAPKDLIGKTIAVPTLVGLTTASLRLWLPQNGVPVDQVKIIEFPMGGLLAALQRGTIDAGLLSEPFLTPARADIRDLGHPYDAIGNEFLVSVWYAGKAWIDVDRDRARKVVAAIYDTARWSNSHRDETFQILVRDGKLDGDKLKGMVRVTFATGLTPVLMQPVLNAVAALKIIDRQVDANTLIQPV